MNVRQLIGAPTFALAPEHVLRRATPAEIGVIDRTLGQLVGVSHLHVLFLWRHQWPHPGGAIQHLPEAQWRYFVIAFAGVNTTVNNLGSAFDIATLELEIGPVILNNTFGLGEGGGMSYNPGRLFHVLNYASHDPSFFRDVTANHIAEVVAIRAAIEAHDNSVLDLGRPLADLNQLKALPHTSPLRFLGYFGVLESLLTHSPKQTDPYDSITRQVRTKLALLDHRWTPHLDYGAFGGTEPENVWRKMYSYRSKVAHGDPTQFTGELAALGSHDNALRLIKDAVKALIRYALKEPQLIVDLRDC